VRTAGSLRAIDCEVARRLLRFSLSLHLFLWPPQPRVAAGTLRDRDADVFTPAQLARIHRMYRWRTIIGPSYRADMWAELEKDAKPTAELARRAYGSFATAWKVRKDWNILHAN